MLHDLNDFYVTKGDAQKIVEKSAEKTAREATKDQARRPELPKTTSQRRTRSNSSARWLWAVSRRTRRRQTLSATSKAICPNTPKGVEEVYAYQLGVGGSLRVQHEHVQLPQASRCEGQVQTQTKRGMASGRQ